jgi:heme-degrading monooxygenase HmoA
MFIAMNRFRIASGKEAEFIEIWKSRDSRLGDVPGFLSFNLLQGPSDEDATLFVSHTMWASAKDFENWTQSEAFRQAHASAGGKTRDIYLGPPQFEGFESVLAS